MILKMLNELKSIIKSLIKFIGKVFRVIIYPVLTIIWIATTILACMAYSKPYQIDEKIQENLIKQSSRFDIKAEVVPGVLYPKGGISTPEVAILSKITKSILVHLDTEVAVEKPVNVKGAQQASIILVAEGLWEKKIYTSQKNEFNYNGSDIKIIQSDFTINLPEILTLIESIEKEIAIRPTKYLLKVKPEIEGNIYYDDNKFAIEAIPELILDYSSGTIKIAKSIEQINEIVPVSWKKEITKELPIIKNKITIQAFELFGKSYDLIQSRYLFSSTAILLLLIGITIITRKMIKKRSLMPEFERIDKKYKNHLICVEQETYASDKNILSLKTFKALLQMAQDKDCPILRCVYKDSPVTYYILDGNNIYSYETCNNITSDYKRENNIPGSERFYDL